MGRYLWATEILSLCAIFAIGNIYYTVLKLRRKRAKVDFYGIHYNNGRNGSCLTWLATSLEEKRRLMLPHEDDVLNKFRIWKERHIQMGENRTSHLVG